MRSTRVVGESDSQYRNAAEVATVVGSITASSDIEESEGRQMKQCWINYTKNQQMNIRRFPHICENLSLLQYTVYMSQQWFMLYIKQKYIFPNLEYDFVPDPKFPRKRCKFPFLFRYSSVCVNLSSIKNSKKYKCVIFKKKKSLQRSLPPGICSIFLLTFYLNAAAIPVSNSSEITGFIHS